MFIERFLYYFTKEFKHLASNATDRDRSPRHWLQGHALTPEGNPEKETWVLWVRLHLQKQLSSIQV